MTLTLELTDAEKTKLNSIATDAGVDIGSVVHKLISDASVPYQNELTPAQTVLRWRTDGIIGAPWGEDIDAPDLVRQWRRESEPNIWSQN